MKLHKNSIVRLHDLYHRKEGERYIVGNPETGEYLFVTAVELRALQLVNTNITLEQVRILLAKEQETVDLHAFLHTLRERGFIHTIDNRVITPRHEPLHDIPTGNVRWLGGQSARFLLILLSVFGVITLAVYSNFPSFLSFFYNDSLTILLLTVIFFAWLLIAARQFFKYAAAQHLGIQARFGFTNVYHCFIPKTYLQPVHEDQHHYVLAMSLLSLTALTSVALLLSTFLPAPYGAFWAVAFAVGFIELLSECLLFLDTDFAKFIALTTSVHKLNHQTSQALKEDVRLFFKGTGKQSHPAITKYAFFYMLSMLIAVILVAAYILPAMLYFLLLAFKHFTPGDPLFTDSFIALLFFSVDLLLYSFALLRHHSLSHNNLFINTSLVAVTVASYVLAIVGVEVFMAGGDQLLSIIFTYLLGTVVALFFEYAVRYAYPFTEHHTLFSSAVLPVIAACIPISLLFTVTYTVDLYVYSLILGVGMLTALVFSHLRHITAPTN